MPAARVVTSHDGRMPRGVQEPEAKERWSRTDDSPKPQARQEVPRRIEVVEVRYPFGSKISLEMALIRPWEVPRSGRQDLRPRSYKVHSHYHLRLSSDRLPERFRVLCVRTVERASLFELRALKDRIEDGCLDMLHSF